MFLPKQMAPNVSFNYPPFNFNGVYEYAIEETESEKRVMTGNKNSKPLMTSLELLTNYWTTMVKKPKPVGPASETRDLEVPCAKLSTIDIVKVAGARYIQIPEQGENHHSILDHPFGSAFSGLPEEDVKEVELVQFLLAAAEKVGDGQYDRAGRLLAYCELLSSKRASPAQRVVLCFAESLRDRIDGEMGRVGFEDGVELGGEKRSKKNGVMDHGMRQGLGTSLTSLICHRQLPFTQVTQFASLQSIIEETSSASRVHVIDLEIRSGIQWIVLMQALADRARNSEGQVKRLRITAVVSNWEFQGEVQHAGERLSKMAESMSIPFSFDSIIVPGFNGISEDTFRLENEETVVVYAAFVLRMMLWRPGRLESLMRLVRKLSPDLLIVTEVEANHNSPSFLGRCVEALFFYAAYFDCLEECMDEGHSGHYRRVVEEAFRGGIRNIVGKEGEERVTRSVKIEVWRAFFGRFGMVEVGFSESSLYQASLVANSGKQFVNSCSLELSGKGLLVGWKGTPVLSLSAWKFR